MWSEGPRRRSSRKLSRSARSPSATTSTSPVSRLRTKPVRPQAWARVLRKGPEANHLHLPAHERTHARGTSQGIGHADSFGTGGPKVPAACNAKAGRRVIESERGGGRNRVNRMGDGEPQGGRGMRPAGSPPGPNHPLIWFSMAVRREWEYTCLSRARGAGERERDGTLSLTDVGMAGAGDRGGLRPPLHPRHRPDAGRAGDEAVSLHQAVATTTRSPSTARPATRPTCSCRACASSSGSIYKVTKFPWVQVPAGEIGVVIAQVGQPLPIGAKSAVYKPEFGNFTDLRGFIDNGGQKGVQRPVLPPGTLVPIHPVASWSSPSARSTACPFRRSLQASADRAGEPDVRRPSACGRSSSNWSASQPQPGRATDSIVDMVGIVTTSRASRCPPATSPAGWAVSTT